MKIIYVFLLIELGYEGIKRIIFPSQNKKEILLERKKAIEKKFKEEKDHLEWIRKDFPHFEPREDTDKQKIADRFCVMRWEETEFECVCKELGIKQKNKKIGGKNKNENNIK